MSISIDYDLCENTGACVAVCPEEVLEQENGHTVIVNAGACSSCWICVDNCVSGAIEIDLIGSRALVSSAASPRPPLARRAGRG